MYLYNCHYYININTHIIFSFLLQDLMYLFCYILTFIFHINVKNVHYLLYALHIFTSISIVFHLFTKEVLSGFYYSFCSQVRMYYHIKNDRYSTMKIVMIRLHSHLFLNDYQVGPIHYLPKPILSHFF